MRGRKWMPFELSAMMGPEPNTLAAGGSWDVLSPPPRCFILLKCECAYGFEKNRKNLRLHFIEFVAFKTVNSSEEFNVAASRGSFGCRLFLAHFSSPSESPKGLRRRHLDMYSPITHRRHHHQHHVCKGK